jgi:hypothetical protein
VESIIMAVLMGGLGGPALAWAMATPKSRKAHAERKARFEEGRGSDPEKFPVGPHKPFVTNALFWGVVYAAIGFFLGSLV